MSASVPVVTDRPNARAGARGRLVLPALGLVTALAGPWPGAVSSACAAPADSLTALDGRIVRRVEIVPRMIFDPPPERGRAFYAFANRLHVRTRHATVRGALVVHEGDTWTEAGRAESERHLRALEFLVPDTLTAVAVGADSVDVRVVTHDNWTTSPEFGIESGGGQHYGSFSFVERNFLGLGTSLSLAYRTDVSGISRVAAVEDEQLFGSHWRGRMSASRGSSGRGEGAQIMLPFWSDAAPRTMGIQWQRDDLESDQFADGVLASHVSGEVANGDVTWGVGRMHAGRIERLVGSFELRDRSLGPEVPRAGAPAGFARPAEDLRVRRFAAELRIARPHYIVRRGVDLMDRNEDFDMGAGVALKGGFAPHLLGSTADEGYARVRVDLGKDAGRLGFGSLHAGGQSRFRRETRELQGDLTARWVNQPRERWTAVVAVTGAAGRRQPADWQLALGGLNGLRAFPVHELTGDQVWRANGELRWIGARDVLKLVSLGAAGFWDAGRAWGPGSDGHGWHQDVGIGLRLSLPHSALNAVARFDVAWPVAPAVDGRHGAAYSFGSGQAF